MFLLLLPYVHRTSHYPTMLQTVTPFFLCVSLRSADEVPY